MCHVCYTSWYMFQDLTGLQLIFLLVSLLVAMTTHEAMHAFTGHALGDTTAQEEGRLTLNPLKHIDLVTTILLPVVLVLSHLPPIFAAKPVPFNPNRVKHDEFGVAMVGVAGPLTNLALAVLAALVFRLIPGFSNNVSDFLVIFVLVNVSLFIFNMIPFPPLDGSRLLFAFAPEPLQRIMISIERMGFMAILLFLFLAYQFIGPTIISLNEKLLHILLGV
jgi:Zn-dependent protease